MSDPIKAAAEKLEEWAGDLILSRGLADAAEAEKILREHLKPRTCDGCRHWKRAEKMDYPHHPPVEFGECLKGVGSLSQYPDLDGCIGDGRQEDGSGEGRTGPKFGCCHWEAKE